jgi:hypothetical protein
MATTTNGVTNRKGEDDGMIHVTDDKLGSNLSHVKTGMTISPELFEKVRLFFMQFRASRCSGH